MEFLRQILAQKQRELETRKKTIPVGLFRSMPGFSRPALSLAGRLRAGRKPGIIAEFKRRSPSLGWIHEGAEAGRIVPGYGAAGAAAISILTDSNFFGGSMADLEAARQHTMLPVLRKDFLVDSYQVMESRAFGADVVLLIAECLEKGQLQDLHDHARELGLEVLVELHHVSQVDKLPCGIEMVGINHRNLQTFRVDMGVSAAVLPHLPAGLVLVAESGLSQPGTILDLWQKGYRGFLVGERFMKEPDPALAASHFIKSLEL